MKYLEGTIRWMDRLHGEIVTYDKSSYFFDCRQVFDQANKGDLILFRVENEKVTIVRRWYKI